MQGTIAAWRGWVVIDSTKMAPSYLPEVVSSAPSAPFPDKTGTRVEFGWLAEWLANLGCLNQHGKYFSLLLPLISNFFAAVKESLSVMETIVRGNGAWGSSEAVQTINPIKAMLIITMHQHHGNSRYIFSFFANVLTCGQGSQGNVNKRLQAHTWLPPFLRWVFFFLQHFLLLSWIYSTNDYLQMDYMYTTGMRTTTTRRAHKTNNGARRCHLPVLLMSFFTSNFKNTNDVSMRRTTVRPTSRSTPTTTTRMTLGNEEDTPAMTPMMPREQRVMMGCF